MLPLITDLTRLPSPSYTNVALENGCEGVVVGAAVGVRVGVWVGVCVGPAGVFVRVGLGPGVVSITVVKGFIPNLCESPAPLPEKPFAQQVILCTTIHLMLQALQPVNMPLGRSVGP